MKAIPVTGCQESLNKRNIAVLEQDNEKCEMFYFCEEEQPGVLRTEYRMFCLPHTLKSG